MLGHLIEIVLLIIPRDGKADDNTDFAWVLNLS